MTFKRAVLGILLLVSFSSISQVSTIVHQADYDAKPVRFGYFMGISISNYRVKHSSTFLDQSQAELINAISSPTRLGLKLGGLINFNRNAHFDVRLMPTVAIYARQVRVDQDDDKVDSKDRAWLEVPIMLKYKSLRRGNMRANVFVGIRPAFQTNAVNLALKNNPNQNTRLGTADFSIDYGAGLEFFRRYFKLAPEIHFTHGLSNALKQGAVGSTPNPLDFLDRVNSHTVTFVLAFE